MTDLPNIRSFLESLAEDDTLTGESMDVVLDGDVAFRINISRVSEDEPRSGSFSILFKTDKSLEELAEEEVYCAGDVDERVDSIEDEFIELIDTHLGYNAYEPLLDVADRNGEEDYDIVMHDSVMVYE